MKNGIILAIGLLMQLVVNGQISIVDHPKEIVCEVGYTAELEPPQAFSNCENDTVFVEINEAMVSGGGCAGKMIITYDYEDYCHNKALTQVFVTLKDTEAPMFYETPADVQLRRGDLVPLPERLFAYDNGGVEPPTVFSERQEDGVIYRTWVCTDACGNSVSHVQRIFLPY